MKLLPASSSGCQWLPAQVMQCDIMGHPWAYSHGTHIHEHGYGFLVGVGLGEGKNTHELPVMSTSSYHSSVVVVYHTS